MDDTRPRSTRSLGDEMSNTALIPWDELDAEVSEDKSKSNGGGCPCGAMSKYRSSCTYFSPLYCLSLPSVFFPRLTVSDLLLPRGEAAREKLPSRFNLPILFRISPRISATTHLSSNANTN